MRETVGSESRSGDLTVAGSLVSTHAASHESGGSDELELAQSQVTDLTTDLAAKVSFTYGTATPASANQGDLWFDSNGTPATVKFYDGSSWQTV